jgi:hypothetical protein
MASNGTRSPPTCPLRRFGRQKGTPNRATAARVAAIAASGMTPLDYLVSVYRDETASRAERLEAATHSTKPAQMRSGGRKLCRMAALAQVKPSVLKA